MESRCIICGLEKKGLKVKEDHVIYAIRWFKRNVSRNEKGYDLVVCRDCYKKYSSARSSYNRKLFAYLGIGILATVLWIAVGGIKLYSIAAGIVLIAFMYLLSLLSYIPGLDVKKPALEKGANARSDRSRRRE